VAVAAHATMSSEGGIKRDAPERSVAAKIFE